MNEEACEGMLNSAQYGNLMPFPIRNRLTSVVAYQSEIAKFVIDFIVAYIIPFSNDKKPIIRESLMLIFIGIR